MATLLGKDASCPIARSLEVVGERWTFLVLREAFFGRTRFTEFRERLGISPDVLAARLATLVDFGVLSRHGYRDEGARERAEYRLTDSGRDLLPILGALAQWSDVHRPTGAAPTIGTTSPDGEPVEVVFATASGTVHPAADVRLVRGARG